MQKKQVLIAHGGEAFDTYEEYVEFLRGHEVTDENMWKAETRRWKDALSEDLGEDFRVFFPEMPSNRNAKYLEWKIWMEKYIIFLEDDATLIGHSLGANFWAKYLSEEDMSVRVQNLHLVAGCYGWKGGFDLRNDLSKIQEQVQNIYIYQSHDDELVPFADAEKFKKALPSAVLIAFEDRGHFIEETFPEIVEKIKETV